MHVGVSEVLDGKRKRWRKLFKMGVGFERVYRRLSGGEQGRFRGDDYAASSVEQNLEGIRMPLPAENNTLSLIHI